MVNGIATQLHYRYKILQDNVMNFGDIRISFTRGGKLNLEQYWKLSPENIQ